MSIEKLRESLAKANKDTFEQGTVIRWEVDAGRDVFVYAAVKCPVGWFTTSRGGNAFVPQTVTYDELVDLLGESRVVKAEVATEWESVL